MVRTPLSFLWTDINIIDPLPHLEKLRLRAKILGWAKPVAHPPTLYLLAPGVIQHLNQ